MVVRTVERDGCLIVSTAGFLSPADAGEYCQSVLKALADAPRAVLCDLSGVPDMSTRGSAAFLLLAGQCTAWSETPVLLVGVAGALRERMRSSRVSELFPAAASVQDGLRVPRAAPGLVLARLRLPPTLEAPRLARRFVGRHCPAGVDRTFVENVEAAAGELVSNVVRHARTDMELRTSWDGSRLRVSVKDTGPGWPSAGTGVGWGEGGRGLTVVAALADSWGCLPTRDGGKAVWCQFRLESS